MTARLLVPLTEWRRLLFFFGHGRTALREQERETGDRGVTLGSRA